MKTKKSFIALSLALSLFLCSSTFTAYATTSDDVYIDATTVTDEQLASIIEDASAQLKTIVIDWQDGAVITLSPNDENEVEPYINRTRAVPLFTYMWTNIATAGPLPGLSSNLRVYNLADNPGSIDVMIESMGQDTSPSSYLCSGVKPGYHASFSIPNDYYIKLRACSVDGSYTIKATDWII